MLDCLSLVSKQVGVLFALMVVGYLCNRRKLLNAVAIKGITELLVLIVTPCVIVHSFIQQRFAASLLGDLGWALAMSVFAHAVGAAIAFLCLHDRDPSRGGVLRFAVIFSNAFTATTPARVSSTTWFVRLKSFTPSSSSMAPICRVSVGCETYSSAAAVVKFRCSASVSTSRI